MSEKADGEGSVQYQDVPFPIGGDAHDPPLSVYLVEERGHTFTWPRRSRYCLPSTVRMRTVRDRSGAPIAVYVQAPSPQEALRTYIEIVLSEDSR